MANTYQLHISEPCTEDWGSMLPEGKGKFCLSCQKSVIDFSNMTDAEILRVLEQSNGSVCGRMRVSQQHRRLVNHKGAQQKQMWYAPWKYVAGLLLGITTQQQVSAQQTGATASTEQNSQPEKTASNVRVRTFRGVAVDERNEGIPGVVVIEKGTRNNTVSDEEGKFSIDVPEDATLYISSMGADQLLTLRPELFEMKDYTITLIEQSSELKEVSIYGGVVINKNIRQHWWQFWKRRYKH